jgi:hypothetical protein
MRMTRGETANNLTINARQTLDLALPTAGG